MKRWILLALLLPTAALAETVTLGGPIDVAQATGCGSSSAQGNVSATLDDQTGAMSWNVTFGNNGPAFDNGSLAPATETAARSRPPWKTGCRRPAARLQTEKSSSTRSSSASLERPTEPARLRRG